MPQSKAETVPDAQSTGGQPHLRRKSARTRVFEPAIEFAIRFSGVLTIGLVLMILGTLVRDAVPILQTAKLSGILFGWNWYPISEPAEFGMLPIVYGSLIVTLIAAVIAVPLGLATAVYIGEVAHSRVRNVLKTLIEGLSAIPSVVLGFIGALVVAPAIKSAFGLPTGLTAFTGGIILAFMALPTIVSITEDALSTVPRQYKEASLALGATRWQTIVRVTLPAAKSGVVASIMLGIGRAIGETMAVLMVTGNSAVIRGIFSPARTMTATIASEMGEAVQQSPHYYALYFVGLCLFAMTFCINLVADLAIGRNRR